MGPGRPATRRPGRGLVRGARSSRVHGGLELVKAWAVAHAWPTVPAGGAGRRAGRARREAGRERTKPGDGAARRRRCPLRRRPRLGHAGRHRRFVDLVVPGLRRRGRAPPGARRRRGLCVTVLACSSIRDRVLRRPGGTGRRIAARSPRADSCGRILADAARMHGPKAAGRVTLPRTIPQGVRCGRASPAGAFWRSAGALQQRAVSHELVAVEAPHSVRALSDGRTSLRHVDGDVIPGAVERARDRLTCQGLCRGQG